MRAVWSSKPTERRLLRQLWVGAGHGKERVMSVSHRCSSCDTENPAEARFCGNCGAPLRALEVSPATQGAAVVGAAPLPLPPVGPMEERLEALDSAAKGLADSLEGVDEQLEAMGEDAHVRCPRCGVENPVEARFCANCGSALAAARGAP